MSEITRFDELFAEDAAVVREIIRKSGELPRLEPGAFRDGFIAGITDMAARADCAVGDGEHQLQDIAEQITMLVSGEAFLVHHPIDPVDSAADKQHALIKTLEAEIERLRQREESAREFVKRHTALSLIDLAEFEAFLKLPEILGPRIDAALAAAKEITQ